jgi:hypothetical protein
VGVIWLLLLWIDMPRGRCGPENALRLEIAGLYWHFVDIVWIAIFTLIYLIAIFYVEALESVLVPALVIMSAGKFLLVVYYYMHLKWDHPIFSRVFFGPMILAAFGVVVGLVILFKWLPTLDPYR